MMANQKHFPAVLFCLTVVSNKTMSKASRLHYLVICLDANGNETVKAVPRLPSHVIKGHDWCSNEGKHRQTNVIC